MKVAIRAERLVKRFGSQVAVSGLSLEIEAGEVFGLLGPNGAGKTTTLRMLAGLYTPDEGEVEVDGLSSRTQANQLRGRVGLLTEQPGLYDRLTAEENLAFFAALYGVPDGEIGGRLERWLTLLGLWAHRQKRAGTLSKGMRQKLAIARAVIHDPPIVLLDEPTSGLDPEAARTVRAAISDLATQGRTLVLCSHNLFEVERLCRRVAVMRPSAAGGQLVALTEVSQLRGDTIGVSVELLGGAAAFAAAAAAVPGVQLVRVVGTLLEADFEGGAQPTPQLVSALAAAGAQIVGVRGRARAFEEAYLDLMAERGAA